VYGKRSLLAAVFELNVKAFMTTSSLYIGRVCVIEGALDVLGALETDGEWLMDGALELVGSLETVGA